jgi:muconate cycloisomerase
MDDVNPTATRTRSASAADVRAVALAVHRVRIPLKTKIAHASHERTFSDNLVAECRLANGAVGFGESAPRVYVTGESIDLSVELLRNADWSGLTAPIRAYPDAARTVDALELPAAPGDERGCVGNAARCAVELAVLDACGRSFGEPLAALAKLPEFAAAYAPTDGCRYSGVLTSAGPRKEFFSALKLRLFGFRQIKIKVGSSGQDDVARLRRFRGLLPGRDLRIDANEAWTLEEAERLLAELELFGITAVEQPLKHEDAPKLAELRRRTRIPVMLDESLCSLRDAERAAAGGWCDLFNIRLSKCGGFLRSLRLAAFAKRHGLACQLGCQVGETGILSAAGRHFACSVADLRYLEGSYDRFLVQERLTKQNLTFGFRGRAPALSGPGLSVDVDRTALKRVTTSTEWLIGGPDE